MKKNSCLFLLLSLVFYSCAKTEVLTVDKVSVGVFGASHSCFDGSEILRSDIERFYGCTVYSNGVPGSTISYKMYSVPYIIENQPPYDVYIIWSPTNDMLWNKLGDINSTDITTQNGALRYCFDLIRKKNSKAKILFFTMLPRFEQKYSQYKYFVSAQKQICEELKIDCVDVSNDSIFNGSNYTQFYLEDKVHLNRDGYKKLLNMQLNAFERLINTVRLEVN